MLLFLFCFRLASAARGYLERLAPSNAMIDRIRGARPKWRAVAGIGALAAGSLALAHVVSEAIAAGAPEWLNLVVLVAAWDAVKFGCLAVSLGARCLRGTTRFLCAKVVG